MSCRGGGALVVLAGVLAFLPVLVPSAVAQQQPPGWERRLEASEPPPTIFHAPVAIHLPTAVTLSRGEWQFEISHRFLPALSDGADAFWGMDGPVNLRIGLGYALADRTMATLARSNVRDNWDFQLKVRAMEGRIAGHPLALAALGGVALSTGVADREALDPANLQYYGQLILNVRVDERWALGVVPSYLHRLRVDEDGSGGGGFLGLNTRIGLSEVVALEGEWNLSPPREDTEHDLGAFGVELETGGHFFKVFLTNSVWLNPGQYLPGASYPFNAEEWRLGFTITRLLRF